MRISFSYLFLVEGERSFIDEEWSVVREVHGEIVGLPIMEGNPENIGENGTGYHIEIVQ